MYKQASKIKLRFDTVIGVLTVEDLWDLPLKDGRCSLDLNTVAKDLHRDVKEDEEVDFVATKSAKDKVLALKFDIVKDIISTKIAEKEAAEDRETKKAQKQQIMSIIADKQAEELKGKSVEELKEMLKD